MTIKRSSGYRIKHTHDIELTELLSNNYNYFHFSEFIENDLFTFDYKLKYGKILNTNAIRILEINEFPDEVTDEAKTLAKQIRQLKWIKSTKN